MGPTLQFEEPYDFLNHLIEMAIELARRTLEAKRGIGHYSSHREPFPRTPTEETVEQKAPMCTTS